MLLEQNHLEEFTKGNIKSMLRITTTDESVCSRSNAYFPARAPVTKMADRSDHCRRLPYGSNRHRTNCIKMRNLKQTFPVVKHRSDRTKGIHIPAPHNTTEFIANDYFLRNDVRIGTG